MSVSLVGCDQHNRLKRDRQQQRKTYCLAKRRTNLFEWSRRNTSDSEDSLTRSALNRGERVR